MKFEKKLFLIISLLTLIFSIISQSKADRLKDLVSFAGIRNSFSIVKAFHLSHKIDYYCFSFDDFKEKTEVKYENIPKLCENFKVEKNLINPIYFD